MSKETKTQLSLEETKKQNKELRTQLTNKNEQYIFQLDARLDQLDYNPVKKVYVINEMLHEIIEGQKKHLQARKIYGTVTEQANHIANDEFEVPEGEQEKSPTWMLYLDGALLLGGIFSLVNGFGAYQDPTTQVGLFQVILNFLLGGVAVLTLIKYSPKHGEAKGMFKYILATVTVMLLWIATIALSLAFIPEVINPTVPPVIIMIIGAIALGAKWYLKKELDIKGTLL